MSSGKAQPYEIHASVGDPGTVVPTAPGVSRLDPSTDSGVDNSDRITKDPRPIVQGGSYFAGGTINLYADGNFIGTTTTDAFANWSLLVPTLSEGPHNLTATMTLSGRTSLPSAPLPIEIDTTNPTITSTAFARSPSQSVRIGYSMSPAGLGTGTLTLTNTTTSEVFTTVGTVFDFFSDLYTVPGNALTDGVYTGTYGPGELTDIAGNPFLAPNPAMQFNFMRADFDGSSDVNFDDLLVLAANYNQTSKTNAQGDANYDGQVNFDDLLILAGTYNTTLTATPGNSGLQAAAAPPTPKVSPTRREEDDDRDNADGPDVLPS